MADDVGDQQAFGVELEAIRDAFDRVGGIGRRRFAGEPEQRAEQRREPARRGLEQVLQRLRLVLAEEVGVAELEVLGTGVDGAEPGPASPKDPVVTVVKTGPLTGSAGSTLTYALSFQNLGPAAASGASLSDVLPAGVTFVSAANGGTYHAATRTVTWSLGNVANGASGTRSLVVRINALTATGTLLLNQASFAAPTVA